MSKALIINKQAIKVFNANGFSTKPYEVTIYPKGERYNPPKAINDSQELLSYLDDLEGNAAIQLAKLTGCYLKPGAVDENVELPRIDMAKGLSSSRAGDRDYSLPDNIYREKDLTSILCDENLSLPFSYVKGIKKTIKSFEKYCNQVESSLEFIFDEKDSESLYTNVTNINLYSSNFASIFEDKYKEDKKVEEDRLRFFSIDGFFGEGKSKTLHILSKHGYAAFNSEFDSFYRTKLRFEIDGSFNLPHKYFKIAVVYSLLKEILTFYKANLGKKIFDKVFYHRSPLSHRFFDYIMSKDDNHLVIDFSHYLYAAILCTGLDYIKSQADTSSPGNPYTFGLSYVILTRDTSFSKISTPYPLIEYRSMEKSLYKDSKYTIFFAYHFFYYILFEKFLSHYKTREGCLDEFYYNTKEDHKKRLLSFELNHVMRRLRFSDELYLDLPASILNTIQRGNDSNEFINTFVELVRIKDKIKKNIVSVVVAVDTQCFDNFGYNEYMASHHMNPTIVPLTLDWEKKLLTEEEFNFVLKFNSYEFSKACKDIFDYIEFITKVIKKFIY